MEQLPLCNSKRVNYDPEMIYANRYVVEHFTRTAMMGVCNNLHRPEIDNILRCGRRTTEPGTTFVELGRNPVFAA